MAGGSAPHLYPETPGREVQLIVDYDQMVRVFDPGPSHQGGHSLTGVVHVCGGNPKSDPYAIDENFPDRRAQALHALGAPRSVTGPEQSHRVGADVVPSALELVSG